MRYYELYEADDRFLTDPSGKPKIFYHGSVDDFPDFDPKKVHDRDGIRLKLGFGPGVLYFTDHPADAARYAARWNKPGANIRPVFLVMHKPFRIKHWDSDNFGWMTAAARGYGSYRVIKTYTARMRKFIRDLQAEGYDGIIQEGSGGTPGEYVVFSASQAISIFDDRARAIDHPLTHA